ncbi:MAG: formimidoylglutamase [Xanthomonadaceae bacterium]|nr:formimidoylglutamase [Xanthomonadaceae bacterium]
MKRFGLIRVQDDEGVLNVGGRVGAARGPVVMSKYLDALKGFEENNSKIIETVDVYPDSGGISKTHQNICEDILRLEKKGLISIVIGGGHDHVFPQIQAYAKSGKNLGCINIDAHFDLRAPNPKVNSGSPFYLAIEGGFLDPKNLIEFGIQKQSNNKEVTAYALKKKVKTRWFNELRNGNAVVEFKKELSQLLKSVDHFILSVDLDAFSESFAPGVSAPQTEGFTSSEGIEMIEIAAESKKCISMGIFELNPLFDQESKTARLAATLIWKWIGAKK